MRSKKLKEIRRRVELNQLRDTDQELIAELLPSYVKLIASLKDPNTTLDDLKKHFMADEKGFMAARKIASLGDAAAESQTPMPRPGNEDRESTEQAREEKDQGTRR